MTDAIRNILPTIAVPGVAKVFHLLYNNWSASNRRIDKEYLL